MSDISGRPVVVGVDGSESSLRAVRWAADRCGRRGTGLRLVHACQVPTGYRPGIVDEGTLRTAMESQSRGWLAEARQAAEQAVPGLHIDTVLEVAPSVPALVKESGDASLLVLGSRGLGGFTGLLVGSTSVELAGRARCPVVVVRGPGDEAPPTEGPVVVGVDGTELSEAAIGFAFAEASVRQAELVALHAWTDLVLETAFPSGAAALDFTPLAQEAEETLAERLAGRQEEYPDVHVTRKVVRERPTRALLRFAENAQLVVVGSRGRGGFRGLLLGSTSQHLLQHARCPVAVVRTDNEA
ncbi:MAG: universal stress protein [Actinophytocola sp.]|uniref:universal stress protein n=1 Tax=Actinophytocola sp. TaxID=1872138 RepID=UPI00132923BF|nr:universal stress protein [Actinophytocola sp.]MPZ85308.1 universal stress protein [Actinophytocola sp.]